MAEAMLRRFARSNASNTLLGWLGLVSVTLSPGKVKAILAPPTLIGAAW